MKKPGSKRLKGRSCQSCEGDTKLLTRAAVTARVKELEGWKLVNQGTCIRRDIVVKHFLDGMGLLNKVAKVAESQGHHPDVRLYGYRNVRIESWTHSIGGLSENDFDLAAKIDALLAKWS
jgi:4a-hydroxytetrahydrobiopterin dehydratase